MMTVTPCFLIFIVSIWIAGASDPLWLADNVSPGSILLHSEAQTALNALLLVMGLLSVAAGYLHWRVGIEPLYTQVQDADSARGDVQPADEDTVC